MRKREVVLANTDIHIDQQVQMKLNKYILASVQLTVKCVLSIRLRFEMEQQFTERNKNMHLIEMRTQGDIRYVPSFDRLSSSLFFFVRRGSKTHQRGASTGRTSEDGSRHLTQALLRSGCKCNSRGCSRPTLLCLVDDPSAAERRQSPAE